MSASPPNSSVHLTTSDPATHLVESLDGAREELTASRIDPHAETERYHQQVLASKGRDLDKSGRALLEEDLRSPCTGEIAVFQAFSRLRNHKSIQAFSRRACH